VALGVQALATEKGRLALITGSGSTVITGAQCTSGLLWWSAATTSIGRPRTVGPKSSTASRAAVTLPT
jgi:branched-chain amino acid transport system substrate-binding protein